MRGIFRAYRSFRWAAQLQREWESAAEFRRRLVHVSAVDQGSEPRDELMTIWSLCNRARERGIDVEPVLREADLSSDADLYGFGSMRMLIMHGPEEQGLGQGSRPTPSTLELRHNDLSSELDLHVTITETRRPNSAPSSGPS